MLYSSIDWHLFPFFSFYYNYLLLFIFLARVRFFRGTCYYLKDVILKLSSIYTWSYLMSQQGKVFYVIFVFSCFDFHKFYLRDPIFKNLNELYEFNCPRWPSGLWPFVFNLNEALNSQTDCFKNRCHLFTIKIFLAIFILCWK